MAVKCYWLEPTGYANESCMVECSACGHVTERYVGKIPYNGRPDSPRTEWEDMEWPLECDHCPRTFGPDFEEDRRSSDRPPLFRSPDGKIAALRQWAPGAMWDATWYTTKGEDGRCIVVRLPGNHDWVIDSRAANCSRPADDGHKCWCRHGEPPELTVDKGCDTCPDGGGSIWALQGQGEENGEWHGFLRNGWLVKTDEPVPA